MIRAEPLTARAFAPFGDVIETADKPDKIINQGQCGRFHDLARLDCSDGRFGISLFDAQIRTLPMTLQMVERHPLGSQAFIPMAFVPFLVTVCADPAHAAPRAFLSRAGQGVNFHRGTWHGVLTPLHAPGLFAVVDRIGDETNLEEHWFDAPYRITL